MQTDQAAVSAYIDRFDEALTSGTASAAQRARDAIIGPVRGSTSVSFRLYYGGLLTDTVRAMTGPDTDPWRVQLGLAVAGAVATDPMLEVILGAMTDSRPAVRLAAARDLGALLHQVDLDRDAIQNARLTRAIEHARDTLAQEPSVFVAAEIAKALASPTHTPEIQDQTLVAMCKGFAAWLDAAQNQNPKATNETLIVTLGALRSARAQFVARQIAGGAPPTLADAVRLLADSALAAGRTVLADAGHGDRVRELADRVTSVADAVRLLADDG